MDEGGCAEGGKKGRNSGRRKPEKTFCAPKLVSKLYYRMQAYGNHYQCDGELSVGIVNYDCGVASILNAQGSTIKV